MVEGITLEGVDAEVAICANQILDVGTVMAVEWHVVNVLLHHMLIILFIVLRCDASFCIIYSPH